MSTKIQKFDRRQHMNRDSFEIFRYKDAYLREVSLHHHDFYEVYYFLSGNVQYNIESYSYQLSPGDVLLISPLELHQPVFGQERQTYERFVLWIDRKFLDGFSLPGNDLRPCFNTAAPGRGRLLRFSGIQRRLLTFHMEQLLAESSTREPYGELQALAYLAQILVMLNRQALREVLPPEVPPAESVIYRILTYINDHYNEDLSLDQLANRFFISKYHLSREFQRLVGTSVHRYIILKRLVMAKQMLSQGVSSSVVCQQCGFGDYSNFYRAFKGEYQISPKEFVSQIRTPGETFPPRLREHLER